MSRLAPKPTAIAAALLVALAAAFARFSTNLFGPDRPGQNTDPKGEPVRRRAVGSPAEGLYCT
ncbi:hypothetical protein ACIBUY_18835 [Streptomyces sp. NPDC050085]|uniref:hypothetical protein n=1 Tax=Streptomyces sp. NPDC050085 TaxID=3365600 RepID=UPI0037ADB8FA